MGTRAAATFPYYITLKDIFMASYIKVIKVLTVKLNHIDNIDGNALRLNKPHSFLVRH